MDKQRAILTAAQTLFARFGLKKVTTDDIAKEAKVSKATVYKYYTNKVVIFREVVAIESNLLLEAIRKAVDSQTTAAGKFRAHLLTKMARIKDLVNFYQVTQEPGDRYWPYISEAREEFARDEKKIVADMLRHGIEQNELDVPQIDLVAHMMVTSLHSQEMAWAKSDLGVSLESYIDTMTDVMINGIRKR